MTDSKRPRTRRRPRTDLPRIPIRQSDPVPNLQDIAKIATDGILKSIDVGKLAELADAPLSAAMAELAKTGELLTARFGEAWQREAPPRLADLTPVMTFRPSEEVEATDRVREAIADLAAVSAAMNAQLKTLVVLAGDARDSARTLNKLTAVLIFLTIVLTVMTGVLVYRTLIAPGVV